MTGFNFNDTYSSPKTHPCSLLLYPGTGGMDDIRVRDGAAIGARLHRVFINWEYILFVIQDNRWSEILTRPNDKYPGGGGRNYWLNVSPPECAVVRFFGPGKKNIYIYK